MRISVDQGSDNLDVPLAVRRLDDGRVAVVIFSRTAAGGGSLVLQLLTAEGLPDTAAAANGRVTLPTASGQLSLEATAALFDGEGRILSVARDGDTGTQLRLWRHDLSGALLDTGSLGAAGFALTPRSLAQDHQGRPLVGGRILASGGAEVDSNGFVTRLTPSLGVDLGFAVRIVSYAATERDEVTALAVDGNDAVYACGSVGNLNGVPNPVSLGLVRLLSSGAIDTTFGSAGKVVENYPVGGATATPCADVAVSPSSPDRVLAAGLATPSVGLPTTFVAAFDLAGTRLSPWGTNANGLTFTDFGLNASQSVASPLLNLGGTETDAERPIVIGSAYVDGGSVSTLALNGLRLDGSNDVSFGEAGFTQVPLLVPVIMGSRRDTFPAAHFRDRHGLIVASSYQVSGNFDVLVTRFLGPFSFADGFESP